MSQALASLSLALLIAGSAMAEDNPQEFPKPGEEQAKLKQMEGDWDGEVTCHLQKEPTDGIFTAKMDLGGFFLVTEFKAKIMGMPFHGRGMTGYDPFQKKYVMVWADSMSPAIYHGEGSFDDDGKVFTEKMTGPGPEGKPMNMRMTTTLEDKDHMTFVIYGEHEGKEMQMMQVKYTRKNAKTASTK